MSNERRLIGSPFARGLDETRPYRVDVSVWGAGTYSNPTVAVYDESGVDVTGDVLTGSASFSTNWLTTPDFVADSMTAGKDYRMLVSWDVDGKTVSAYGYIQAQQ